MIDTFTNDWLLEYRRDKYSQSGEDGIIEKILEMLPNNDLWCVEFGAWDGVHLTNSRNLIEERDYSGVLIEGNPKRYVQLEQNYAEHNRRNANKVIAIQGFVGFDDDDNLDRILADTPIPRDFDLLSIDIDGNDYHVWKRLRDFQPKVVVIEFNPTIPNGVEFVQHADSSVCHGSSLHSVVGMAREKGYELVCVLHLNAFFVKAEYFPLFHIACNSPEMLRTDLSSVTYLFTGYDGTVLLRGRCELPWHNVGLKESKVQAIPGFMRRFPGDYSYLQALAFSFFLLLHNPRRFRRNVEEVLDLEQWLRRKLSRPTLRARRLPVRRRGSATSR